jgi:hypothetical protein
VESSIPNRSRKHRAASLGVIGIAYKHKPGGQDLEADGSGGSPGWSALLVFLDELGVLEVLLGEVGRHLGDDEAGDGEPREEGPVALPLPVEEDRPQPTDRQTYASASTCATITKFGGHLPHASNQAWARLIRNGKWRKNKIKQQELHWLLIGLGYTHSTDTCIVRRTQNLRNY